MSLSGKKHTVYTGVAVIRGDRELCSAEASDVYFRELDESEVEAYIATGEPMDKAGAYAAQGLGALFVRRIEGDFFNVMGLPICRLGLMLKEFNLGVL
jgi:septum formation protein